MSQETYQFPCPHCRTALTLPRAMAGVQGPCPNCTGHLVAPPAPQAVMAQAFAAMPQAVAAVASHYSQQMPPQAPQPAYAPAYSQPVAPQHQATPQVPAAYAGPAENYATPAYAQPTATYSATPPSFPAPLADLSAQAGSLMQNVKARNTGGLLRLEDAPATGYGRMAADSERTFAMLAHPFALIIWLWKRKESKVVDAHGKEALNFGITMWLLLIPVVFASSFLIAMLQSALVAQLYSLGMMVVNLVFLGLVIYGAVQAGKGKLLRYPINFRFIK